MEPHCANCAHIAKIVNRWFANIAHTVAVKQA